MAFTIKHYHYTSDKDERGGTRLAFFKVYEDGVLVAVVEEPDAGNFINTVSAQLFGKEPPKERAELQVRCDTRNANNIELKAFLDTSFRDRTFRYDPSPNWIWRDDPHGAEEMPWG